MGEWTRNRIQDVIYRCAPVKLITPTYRVSRQCEAQGTTKRFRGYCGRACNRADEHLVRPTARRQQPEVLTIILNWSTVSRRKEVAEKRTYDSPLTKDDVPARLILVHEKRINASAPRSLARDLGRSRWVSSIYVMRPYEERKYSMPWIRSPMPPPPVYHHHNTDLRGCIQPRYVKSLDKHPGFCLV